MVNVLSYNELNSKFSKLKDENYDLVNANIDKEFEIKNLKLEIAKLKQIIFNYKTNFISKNENLNMVNKLNDYILNQEKDSVSKYEKTVEQLNSEISRLKNENLMFSQKNFRVTNFKRYLNELDKENFNLEEQIENLKSGFEKNLDIIKQKNEIENIKLKERTLKVIEKAKANILKNYSENNQINYKLLLLQNQEVCSQLSEQSKILEETVLELEKNKKINLKLKSELEIHIELEKVLTINNKKLSEKLSKLTEDLKIETPKNNMKSSNKLQEFNFFRGITPLNTKESKRRFFKNLSVLDINENKLDSRSSDTKIFSNSNNKKIILNGGCTNPNKVMQFSNNYLIKLKCAKSKKLKIKSANFSNFE